MWGLVIGWMTGAALAGDGTCGLLGADKIDLGGITAVALRGVEGDVEVVAADGFEVRQGSSVCTTPDKHAPVVVRLARKGTVLVATVSSDGEPPKLTFSVPRTIAALTVDEQVGALVVRDVPTRVAVLSNEGPVEVTGAKSLRVAYGRGDVRADRLESDVILDHVTGNVAVDDVAGGLATSNISGTVHHTNVRGAVEAL